jgi:isoquinoline 1-oxidoreductase beta subunit
VAIVADVTVSREGELAIKKLTAVVDAGTIINLSAAESQVQGAMLDGISAAWFQKITIEHGAAAQTNFHDYRMLRMNHSPPVVDVQFVKSTAPQPAWASLVFRRRRRRSATPFSPPREFASVPCRSSTAA